jgi:glutamate racemase
MIVKNLITSIAIVSLLSCSEANKSQQVDDNMAIENAILNDQESFYYIDFANYPEQEKSLPIGVFDSGTGGLTVLNSLVEFDKHNNANNTSGQDGLPDFRREKFIYLADQANMPYGNYSSENKTDLLVEHILKDTQFLLADKYYEGDDATEYRTDKQKVKAIVIACNTATAYGKEYIEEFIQKTGIQLKVLGVIDAGARGALQVFGKEESGSIGVFATVGTIASKGYGNTIKKLKDDLGYTGNIQIYNQGGHGLAEAVDEEPDFINRDIEKPRDDYRGPSLNNAEYKIDKTLLDVYNFDFDHNKMLCDSKETDDCQVMQLNSADNYVRYHLVTLMEKMRKAPDAKPLKTIVLGCTHYPYLTEEIRTFLGDLYNYRKNGEYIYRHLLEKDVDIIDPSVNVAIELYDFLKEQKLFNPYGSMDSSEFYISVPNLKNKNVQTESSGRFTYEYKYGRNEGEIQEYVKVVPFSRENIPAETIERLRNSIPETFKLIENFNTANSNTALVNKKEEVH